MLGLLQLTAVLAVESLLLPALTGKTGRDALLLLVPVGPAESLAPLAEQIQQHSDLSLQVGIAVCSSHVPVYNITLCDPEFELGPVLKKVIARANGTGTLTPKDVFVGGHAVGGACARRFVDTSYPQAGGVLLLGVQYTGDTENLLTGFLGYPSNLSQYRTPLFALGGELDKFSVDNMARVVEQWSQLPAPARYRSFVAALPKLDQSSYTLPPTAATTTAGAADLLPEIDGPDALQKVGALAGAWMDFNAALSTSTAVLEATREDTTGLTQAFRAAVELDVGWCKAAQLALPGVPSDTEIEVLNVPGSKLDSCHTKYEVSGGKLKLTLCDYTTYTYNNQPPWEPQYAGAKAIACKLVSEDRIAQLLKLPVPDMKAATVQNRCRELNAAAWDAAKGLVEKHWPRATERYATEGKEVVFLNDTQTHAGPEWLFEDLGFKQSSTAFEVTGTALITTVKALIYPGAHYCKLLSPSKAVDILMTMGLTKRYGSEGVVLV